MMATGLFLLVLLATAATNGGAGERFVQERLAARNVHVHDDILQTNIDRLRNLVQYHSTWRYVDQQTTSTFAGASERPIVVPSRYDWSGWPWLARLNGSLFVNSELGKKLVAELASSSFRNDGSVTDPSSTWNIEEATAYVLRRGDDSRVTGGREGSGGPARGSGTAIQSDVADAAVNVHIELTPGPWKKNDYGETLFYSTATQPASGPREVLSSVHLKSGRIIMWKDSTPFALRPPSMNQPLSRYGVLLRLTQDISRVQRATEQHKKWEKDVDQGCGQLSLHTESEDESQLGDDDTDDDAIDKGQTNSFYHHKPVVIFDNVFTKEQLSTLRHDLLLRHCAFRHQFDSGSPTAKSAGQWFAQYSVPEFVKTSHWKAVRPLVSHVAKRQGWYPYSVEVDVVHSADHLRIHQNCVDAEDEFSILLHLNEDYPPNTHGETAFYELSDAPHHASLKKPFGEEEEEDEENRDASPESSFDLIGAVQPRSGRIIVYDSSIPHSSRPQRSDTHHLNYNLVIKMASSEQVAKAKMLKAILEGGDRASPSRILSTDQIKLLADLTTALAPTEQGSDCSSSSLPDIAELNGLIDREQLNLSTYLAKSAQKLYNQL